MDYKVEPNITLEKLALGHAQTLFNLTNANREYLREWLPWLDSIKSCSDTQKFIESTIEASSAGGAPNFAIIYEGAMCGVAGFHKINHQHKVGSIGYWLSEKYVGNGIMTASVKALLNIGFGEFNLNKIEIHCAEGNTKSRAIPERLGFTYEATLRQCEWLYSKYVNHAIYSMLASEYNA